MLLLNLTSTSPAQALANASNLVADGMSNVDWLALFWTIMTNPLTGYAISALVSFVLYVVLRDRNARELAQAGADYLEFIERQAVIAAELAGWVKGISAYDKLLFAANYVEAQLAKHGIVGDPDRVNVTRIMADLERIKAELFPGKGTTMGQLEEAMKTIPPAAN